jgi:hypothetical protein
MRSNAGRFFGIIGAVGAIAFVVHLIVFFMAFHYGAAVPAGEQTYGIIEHGHAAYVTHVQQLTINVLEIVMLIGLGVGIPGILVLEKLHKKKTKDAHAIKH